jgi:hypothetical protein
MNAVLVELETVFQSFLSSGSQYVHVSTTVEQINIPHIPSEIRVIAGQLNFAGLGETEFAMTDCETQLENLVECLVAALTAAGFSATSVGDCYTYYTREPRD